MGAWGTGPFDNDEAGDFADAVAGSGGLGAIERAFDQVLAADYVEAPAGSAAVAGCEIVAMLLDRPSADTEYPESIDEWSAAAEQVPSEALVEKARKALDRILAPKSELLEQWSEGDDAEAWKAGLADIKRRLTVSSCPT